MTKITSLWHLLVTVLILTERTWSVCGSMELPASHRLRKSRPPSVGRFDSNIGSVALESLTEKAVDRLNLPVACASGARPMPCKRRSRVLLRALQADLQFSRKEVEVLIAFKVGITGDPLGVLSSWRANDSDPCSWLGIACAKSSKRVTALDLSSLQLAGTVSALLGQLSFLRYLDLFNNTFTGEIPETLGNCSRLKFLALGQNNLQGGIPSTLGNCSSLTQLSLESNPGLGGELPLELGNLVLLQGFTIHNCSLQGSFPTWLLNFTDMQDLDLGFNQFSGDIPPSLEKYSKLDVLNLESNLFTGEIPVSIGLLGQLEGMYLDGNELSGEIPTTIGNITCLQDLYLQQNQLTGDIPRSIVNITYLQFIYIYQNQLTGVIPPDIGLLGYLEELDVSNNNLGGTIPSSLSNCTKISGLSLGLNPFRPLVFPSWILSFTSLTEAYLPHMNLEGAIPEDIGKLSQLSKLSLDYNNLTGVLPSSLGNCTSLQVLDVTQNAISGEVPPELGLLSELISLRIGSNFFSAGPFPNFIFNLTMMTQLGVYNNEFSGRLDGDFGRLPELTYFDAPHNEFQGPVPESFANCSKLSELYLGHNSMSGDVPAWLFNSTNLRRLGLSSNRFYGAIPVDFGSNFQLLEELNLSDNNLEGNIPVNMGGLFSLEYLYLQSNNLTGLLPHSLANCTHLVELDISQNKLSGDVSGVAFQTTPPMLTKLNLSHNLFSGSWPSQFKQLTSIEVIDVSHNMMSGPIPLGLGKCIILQTLDLSFNMFNGSIPRDLGELMHLTTFNASYNNFVGPIPDQGVFETNLTAISFLGNPGLCGRILGPQQQCPTLVSAPEGSSHCKGFKCSRLWIPLFSIIGIIIFLMMVLATMYYCRGKKDTRVEDHEKLDMYIVNPRMVFLEKDVLAAIAPGQDNVIGAGAKSIVYKAVSPDGEPIAIKVLRDVQHPWQQDQRDRDQLEKEIMNEVRTLGQLRHRNIVKIFTLCFSLDMKAIILEYMPNGSLHAHLHDHGNCDLTWAQRFRILLGVTHGMVYLHHEFSDPIIHRDLKSSNILLNEDMEAKLCDFGISKFVTNQHGEATASAFCGTFGYMAPEYGTGARLSTKGDVYSYGVVLLELLSVKEATQANSMIPSGGTLEQRFLLSNMQAFELLDPTLKSEGAKNPEVREQMMSTIKVGLSCTDREPQNRPTMNNVLQMLLEIQRIC